MADVPPTKESGVVGPTASEVARQVVKWAESGVVNPPEPESIVLAYAHLALRDALERIAFEAGTRHQVRGIAQDALAELELPE